MRIGRHRKTDTMLAMQYNLKPEMDRAATAYSNGMQAGRRAERADHGGLTPVPRLTWDRQSNWAIGFKRHGSATVCVLQVFTPDSAPYPDITATGIAVKHPTDPDRPSLGRQLAAARAFRTAGIQMELMALQQVDDECD